jgi:hypothetical protein
VEAWVPAYAGMATKSNSRIVTMFVEANWVTASFAGNTKEEAYRIGLAQSAGQACHGMAGR